MAVRITFRALSIPLNLVVTIAVAVVPSWEGTHEGNGDHAQSCIRCSHRSPPFRTIPVVRVRFYTSQSVLYQVDYVEVHTPRNLAFVEQIVTYGDAKLLV